MRWSIVDHVTILEWSKLLFVLATHQLVILTAVLLPAVFFDVKQHRIPNWLSLSGWLMGLLLGAWLGGWDGLLAAGGGLLLLLLCSIPFFFLGWMGAGDVKLITAVGAIVGQGMALNVFLGIVLAGLALALLVLTVNGELLNAFRRYGASLGFSLALRRPTYLSPPEEQTRLIIPYAVPIAVGTFVGVILTYT